MLGGALVSAIIVGLSPLRPTSLRETGLVFLGIFMTAAATWTTNQSRRQSRRNAAAASRNKFGRKYVIQSIEELRKLMPASASGTCLEDAKKVIHYLDDQMTDFIAKSPLLYLATVDASTNAPFVSPKGDEPGFVTVLSNDGDATKGTLRHTLVIPDRPGNRLIFGLQNIVGPGSQAEDEDVADENDENKSIPPPPPARVSVLFEVPGTGTTLRVGGTAMLSAEPALIQAHEARGCPPKLVILVDVEHAFFHCNKAYMRSKVWDPTSWVSPPIKISWGRYFAKKDSFVANLIDKDVDKHFQQVQKAIDGEACEQES